MRAREGEWVTELDNTKVEIMDNKKTETGGRENARKRESNRDGGQQRVDACGGNRGHKWAMGI